VEHFRRHFHRRSDQLGPEHIRHYQAMLFGKMKCSPNTVVLRLRFCYVQVQKRSWSIAEALYPKKVIRLPQILTPEEVAQLIEAENSSVGRSHIFANPTFHQGEQPRPVARHPAIAISRDARQSLDRTERMPHLIGSTE
jgi:hypothetical protein